ncbi:DNA/RNA non-specific endonuclease [Polaromonas hydrogenivorans]|uniref:Endonuclease n=1 Tax=Polaromonas hydrogenivorans TaxID=335476 RepID=A0AAU7LYW0_9BURK
MRKRASTKPSSPRRKSHFIYALVALAIGLSAHSCTDLPVGRKLEAAGAGVQTLAGDLGAALRTYGRALPPGAPESAPAARTGGAAASPATGDFSACRHFFASGRPPVVTPRPTHRALCYDAFAILHSGESKTAVYVAQKLNRALVADAKQKRTDNFFADARLRAAERATLEDYRGSDYDRGHLAPAGQMPTPAAMAQSFSLANMVPQAPQHNQGTWRVSVEDATKKYAGRATGDVYVITGPVYAPSIAQSKGIGPGQVRVPKYLFKLVYDEDKNRAWAYWQLNDNATRGSAPISYGELVRRTGVEFLPGVNAGD